MKTQEVPAAAIERNREWIRAVEIALQEQGDSGLASRIMCRAGQRCAAQILRECEAILGKKPETVDELLSATNQRRLERHGLTSLWEREKNRAHLRIEECACTLVKSGLATPNPVHCLCSKGLMEQLFAGVCNGPVEVELVKTVGRGDDCCEFYVHFTD